MKRKLLFTLMLVALTVMLFAVTAGAADLILSAENIASATSTGEGSDWGNPNQMFDGNRNSASDWLTSNGWAGASGAVCTIIFDDEYTIKNIDLYVWSNWKPGAEVVFYDAQGNETHKVNIDNLSILDGSTWAFPMPEFPFKAKKMVINRRVNDYNLRYFTIVELDIYAEHSCNFTVPGDVISEPTCAMDGEQEYLCPKCGASNIELIPATGNHSISDRVVYRDGFNYPGIIASACATCATQDEKIDDVPAMFKSLGYSASEFGKNGVTHGVFVDWDAIAKFNEYADKNGDAYIDFGMVAGARSAFSDGNPLTITSDGVGVASNVLAFKSFADTDASLISYSLNGFGDMYKDTQLIVSAYIYDGNEIYYLSGDDCYTEVSTVSYNEVLDIAAPPVIEATVKEN